MNTEDSEFARIEREQAMRGVPDAIHHTDTRESLEYITGWNDCRAAMLAEQPAQREPKLFEHWYDKQYGGAEEIGFQQALRIAYGAGQDSVTTPQAQREPLNAAEVEQMLVHHNHKVNGDVARYVVRMTEAAHGIKENT